MCRSVFLGFGHRTLLHGCVEAFLGLELELELIHFFGPDAFALDGERDEVGAVGTLPLYFTTH